MSIDAWTPRLVEVYLAEAADTLRRLPEQRVRGFVSAWPEAVCEKWDALGCEDGPTQAGPPSPQAIDRMDRTLLWLRWLEPEEQRIVWARANGHPWKQIAWEHGINRSTAWRRWTHALVALAARLSAQSDATLSRHQDVQHMGPNLVG
ncbi:DUF6362 family protein [Roseospira visakhapatnamensis]|uniref:DUF6362 domain-containing protein n=1 Tax=Roseospira visakhapatnamensis TaxID=390880 RepID=A0A7W6RG03_9PROT|nr:DUF6362 family protein [Roseospira visakhapatnamensis]MBB4267612.1 hypothetical protein [Roseospira visakhapatnamensis]